VSKKQVRLSDINQIKTRSKEFIDRTITVVLNDNTTIFGELKKLDGNDLVIVNMRQKKIKLPLEKVIELFTDIDA
jgi:hypothetical protein